MDGVVDTFDNFYVLDENTPINQDGFVKGWKIYAKNTLPVQLIDQAIPLLLGLPAVIYRKEGGEYAAVGKSEVVTPEEPGRNWFRLPSAIPVKKGDVVGMYFPKTGSVTFSSDPKGKMRYSKIGGKAQFGPSIFQGQPDFENAFTGQDGRKYSIMVRGWKTDDGDDAVDDDDEGVPPP